MSEMSGPGAGGSYGSITLNNSNVGTATRLGEPVIKEKDSSGGFTQTSISYNFTTKQQANFSLEQAWLDMFGEKPSAKIKKEFYSLLNKLEKKTATRTRTTGSSSGSSQSSKGYTFSTESVLSEFVQKYTPSMFKQGKLGETAATAFDQTVKYINDMGVSVSSKAVLADVTNSILKKSTTKDIKDYYRNQAIKMYPDLAKRLRENSEVTVRDLATTYINKFSIMFDKDEGQVSLTDPDIMDALSKNKSMSDFTASLKKRADYGVTNFAKQEASDLAGAFKRVMGF